MSHWRAKRLSVFLPIYTDVNSGVNRAGTTNLASVSSMAMSDLWGLLMTRSLKTVLCDE
jgi:glutathionyl-hydroquinone reductase